MQAFWTGRASTLSTAAATTDYISIHASWLTSPWTTEPQQNVALSEDITITRITVWLSVAPGSGKSRTVAFRDDGAATAASLTISNTATNATWNGSVSVLALSKVCLQATSAGTPAAAHCYFLIEYTTAGNFYLLPSIATAVAPNTTTNFINPGGAGSSGWTTTVTDRELVCPSAGSVTKLVALTSVAPGASKSWAVSLRQNNTTDSLTATVTGAATTVASTTGTTAMSAGDTFSLKCVPASTPASACVQVCLTVAPTTTGEIIMAGNAMTLSTSAVMYMHFNASDDAWGTPETGGNPFPVPTGTIKNLYVKASVAPGAAKSHTFKLRKNSADTLLSAAVSGAGVTTANNTANSISVTDGDLVNMSATPAGTPAAANGKFGAVFVYPAAAGNTGAFFSMF